MQTDTKPVDDTDIDAWLAGEIELPCEIESKILFFGRYKKCGKPASWAVKLACCNKWMLLCDLCKDMTTHKLARRVLCTACGVRSHPTYISRFGGHR